MIASELDGLDAQNLRGGECLLLSELRELFARRNEDPGILSGVPVRCAVQIYFDARIGVLGQDSTDAVRLVVRMREDATNTMCQLIAPTTAEQSQDEEEHVQQVEIDRHRCRHVVILSVLTRTQQAPCIEDQQARENQNAD